MTAEERAGLQLFCRDVEEFSRDPAIQADFQNWLKAGKPEDWHIKKEGNSA